MGFILADFLLIFLAMLLLGYRRQDVQRAIRLFQGLARRKRTCIVLVALLPVLVRLALLPSLGVPQPSIHDEFSYLLGAETFAQGRLANPPHPMARYFETFHVNFDPTYSSKYPPAQAAFLALGWKLFGHSWAGVLLAAAFMTGAVCWMLQGWLPPPWALLGALIFAFQSGILQYWTNSYWGGAVAAGAGALVLGALPRIRNRDGFSGGVALGIGMFILANCRPFEGLVLVAAVAVLLLVHSLRTTHTFRWLAPVAAAGVLTFLFIGYYNYRLTGNPWLMPYKLHELHYGAVPLFWFLAPHGPPPPYNFDSFRQFWAVWDVGIYNGMRARPWFFTATKLETLYWYFIRAWPLTIPLAVVPFLVTSRRARWPLAILTVFVLCLFLEKGILPHYFAPAVALLFLLLTMALRKLRYWKLDRTLNGEMILAVILAGWAGQIGAEMLLTRLDDSPETAGLLTKRRQVMAQLEAAPGRHLVLVQYGPTHNFHDEWIYNHADIDASPIVWAHDISPTENQPLLKYYSDRDVWSLNPDGPQVALVRTR